MNLLRRVAILSTVTTSFLSVIGAQDQRRNAKNDAIEKEIVATEELKNDAMQKGDTRVLEQIYADDLIFVNARGRVLTKLDRVKEFRSGNVRYVSFRQGEYQFHIYGDTVVVTGYACSVVKYHGTINRIPRRFTSTYVKLNGRWRFVAHQATLVSDEDARNVTFCSN